MIRVIDFETTGGAPPAKVCEVGYCDIIDGRVMDPVSYLCAVSSIPPNIRAIHHIRVSDTAGHPPFDPSVFADDDVDHYAAHNAAFEMQFFTPPRPMICTYKAALRIWLDAPSHGNGALLYWLEDQGLVSFNPDAVLPAHRAGPDAYATAHILTALMAAGAIEEDMVQWTQEPPILPRITIGKYRGQPWSEADTGYLRWMTNQETMDKALKFNAALELERRDQSRSAGG